MFNSCTKLSEILLVSLEVEAGSARCVCVCVGGGGEQSDTPEKTSLKISSLIRVNIVEAEENQSSLLHEIVEFYEISRPRLKEGKDKKTNTYECACTLYEVRELTLHFFKSVIIPLKII